MLVLLAAFSRLLPHPNNFTAIGALAIFAAMNMPNKWLSALLPLAAMFISDLVINNVVYAAYSPTFVWLSEGFVWIYLGVFAHTVSAWVTSGRSKVVSSAASSVLGAVLFFLLSNYGVWVGSGIYPASQQGLLLCYTAALPFFGNMLLGNLFFCALLFGVHYFLLKNVKVLQTA
jgi:hypothetical protein